MFDGIKSLMKGGSEEPKEKPNFFFGEFVCGIDRTTGDTHFGRITSIGNGMVSVSSPHRAHVVRSFPVEDVAYARLRPFTVQEVMQLIGTRLVRYESGMTHIYAEMNRAEIPQVRLLVHAVEDKKFADDTGKERHVTRINENVGGDCLEDDAWRLYCEGWLVEPFETPCGVWEVTPDGKADKDTEKLFGGDLFGTRGREKPAV